MTLEQAEQLLRDLETAERNREALRPRTLDKGSPAFSYWSGRLDQLISVDNTIGFSRMVREAKSEENRSRSPKCKVCGTVIDDMGECAHTLYGFLDSKR